MKGMKLMLHLILQNGLIFIRGKVLIQLKASEMTSTDYAGKTTSLIEKGLKATSDISLNGDFINLKK